MSESSDSIPLALLGDGSEHTTPDPPRYIDAEAEECEEDPTDDGRESDSNQDIAPFVAPDIADADAGDAPLVEAGAVAQVYGEEDPMPAPHAQRNKSFVSETGDDGFAALAAEFADFNPGSPAVAAVQAGAAIKLQDPHLPSDPHSLEAEKVALEGPGTGQLKLELRSIEMTGMRLLRKQKECHDYAVFLRNVLHQHNTPHVRHSLAAVVSGSQRGEYLFDRLRRRYWARVKGASVADLCNEPLPTVSGTVTVQLPLEPSEVGFAGVAIPTLQSKIIGARAAGQVVQQHMVRGAQGMEKVDGSEALVILAAEAEVVYSTSIIGGTYGSYTASVAVRAEMVPAREGGTITGLVTSCEKPNFQLNRSISNPLQMGQAVLSVGPKRSITVTFGAEVPARSAAMGRVWVVRLTRNKERKWWVEFALDPFVMGERGDQEDAPPLTAKEVSNLNLHRRPVITPQAAKSWAAVTDLATGWRVVHRLPETGFWHPASLQEMFGHQIIRGVELEIGTKGYNDELVNYAAVAVSDHEKSHKTSQRARVEVRINGILAETTVQTPYAKHQKRHSQTLCLKIARSIEVLVLLIRAGVEPQAGTLSFTEDTVSHDDTEPSQFIDEPEKKKKKKRSDEADGSSKKARTA